MDIGVKSEATSQPAADTADGVQGTTQTKSKKDKDASSGSKRRCVSTACIACRRRKSKCDGNLPKCAACASVYLTECEYAPHTDHRRKGVYKKDVDNVKTKQSTLQILVHAILNRDEGDAFDLVRQIRSCDSLEELALAVENKEKGLIPDSPDSPIYGGEDEVPQFEAELSGRMGDLLIDGSVKFIGGTSNLIWLNDSDLAAPTSPQSSHSGVLKPRREAIMGWTTITKDQDMILHFINMYFCWHYAYFTTLSKELFYRDFLTGTHSEYCSPLLVNVMLALGCHFSIRPEARADPEDSSTTGDHFFAEAQRLLHMGDEIVSAKLCTVQAMALMSVREAGCGRESRGWVYSGMSFRMASDLGLNVDTEAMNGATKLSDEDIDARRITFWGCFFFDKCWSNYLGRQPQLLSANINVQKPEVFASEDAEMWSPYTDAGVVNANVQPARTRAVALQIYRLGEISSDLLTAFYQPQNVDKPTTKQGELKKLTDIHTRLESWKRELPLEMEPKDGQLPQVLLMHMFYQLLYIHLYRPFLRYTKTTSPLPAHVSPRKFCTQAAGTISKLFRLYKRTHGLRQICNIAVYIAHSACTIHLLNLPDKTAKRDIIHGVKQLEEVGELWLCARRTLRILGLCAEKWNIEMPEEANATLERARLRWGNTEPSSGTMSPEVKLNITRQLQASPVQERLFQQSLDQHSRSQQHSPAESQYHSPINGHPVLPLATGRGMPSNADQTSTRFANVYSQQQQHNNSAANRPKPTLQLTKAQQDAWNAHQARMGQVNFPRAQAPETKANAATLFGGVDSLMEESQDWWVNDQSQLAVGFDNWTSPTATDWSSMATGYSTSMPTDSALSLSTTSDPSYFVGNTMTSNGYSSITSPNGVSLHDYSTSHSRQPPQQQQQQMRSSNPPGMNLNLNVSANRAMNNNFSHSHSNSASPVIPRSSNNVQTVNGSGGGRAMPQLTAISSSNSMRQQQKRINDFDDDDDDFY